MAPMAMGGNLPYRRLCRRVRGRAHLQRNGPGRQAGQGRRTPPDPAPCQETDFGVQLAGKRPEVMAEAAAIAVDGGARFIDLNFGCPIDLIVKRGAGAALLKRPGKAGRDRGRRPRRGRRAPVGQAPAGLHREQETQRGRPGPAVPGGGRRRRWASTAAPAISATG